MASLKHRLSRSRRTASECAKKTGPVTQPGRDRSRCNAVRHGLAAETVIRALEDAEDYKAFEATCVTQSPQQICGPQHEFSFDGGLSQECAADYRKSVPNTWPPANTEKRAQQLSLRTKSSFMAGSLSFCHGYARYFCDGISLML